MPQPNPERDTGVPAGSEGERMLGALFGSIPVPMAALDADGRVVEVNGAWRALAAECDAPGAAVAVGESFLAGASSSGHPAGPELAAAVRRVLDGDAAQVDREYPCTAAGATRWLVASVYAEASGSGRRALVVQADVTARREGWRDLEERDALFEQASDGIVVADGVTGRVLKANRRAADIFGYAPDELVGLPIGSLVTEESQERDPIELGGFRPGRRVVKERVGLRKDGRRITIEISARMLKDGRILGLVRDITARRRQTAALRRQAAQLAERVREQQTLYGVSRMLQAVDTLDTTLVEVVRLIPGGWQHPELAEARITLDGARHETPGYRPSPWRLRCEIVVEGAVRGTVELAYRERPPEGPPGGTPLDTGGPADGIFLVEELDLLEEIAARIGEAVRRRQAEARLRHSEAYYRALTEKAVDMVTITDRAGHSRYLSPSFQDILGLPAHERLGRSVFELVHPEDRDRLRREFEAALEDPSYQPTVEFRIRHASGDWRILESTGRNLLDDPAVQGIVIESRDVTARRDAEEQVRFQAQLLDSVGQSVVATDARGRIIYWNPASEHVYGWPRDEALGRRAKDVLPMDLDYPGSRALNEAVKRQESWAGEILAIRRDGRRAPLLIADVPLLDEEGGFAGYVAVASDLTELKAAERAVRESEERLRSLAENSSDLIAVLDADGLITYASANRKRILGEDSESAIGKPFTPAESVHPDDRERTEALWREVLERPGETLSGEVRVRHADGSWRLLEVYARNLLDNPAVAGLVVNARDVTERAHLEQQLQQALKMEAVGRLAGGVAHDFNNLLTGISGYAQLALETLSSDHPVHPYLVEVERSGQRAAALTRQLLAFSRRQVMQPRLVDPDRTVRELTGMLTRLIGEDVRLVTALETDGARVHVDPGQLEQVIVNLAVNARDAMPMGGQLGIRTRCVTLGVRELGADGQGLAPGEYVELAVSDTGAGMSPEVMERVFEPFFTTKELGKGTGLGLSTVYGIVKQSGGLVRVESERGDGTTFRVFFPLVSGLEDEDAADPERPAPALDAAGETLLLVEDDDAVRRLATRVLRGRGYQVITASNGADGLRQFEMARHEGRGIDLILSDVVMPGLGGREMLELVRELDPAVPVIFMSGYTDDVLLRHGVGQQGVQFLEKPFTPGILAARVRDVLDAVEPDRPGGSH